MQTVGPYTLLKTLGTCQLGSVEEAVDQAGQHVTVAVLNAESAADQQVRSSFESAAQALARFKLPILNSDFTTATPWVACAPDGGPGPAQIFIGLGQAYTPVQSAPAGRPAEPPTVAFAPPGFEPTGFEPTGPAGAVTQVSGAPVGSQVDGGHPTSPANGPEQAETDSRPVSASPWREPPRPVHRPAASGYAPPGDAAEQRTEAIPAQRATTQAGAQDQATPPQPEPPVRPEHSGQPEFPTQPVPLTSGVPVAVPMPAPIPVSMPTVATGVPAPADQTFAGQTPAGPTPGIPVFDDPWAAHAGPAHPVSGTPPQVSGTPYPVSGTPSPASGMPYQPQPSGVPYQTSGMPYQPQTSGVPYQTSGMPYQPSGVPYPVSGAPHPQSGRVPSAPHGPVLGADTPPPGRRRRTGLWIAISTLVVLLLAAGGTFVAVQMFKKQDNKPQVAGSTAPLPPPSTAAPSRPGVEPPRPGDWPTKWPTFSSKDSTKRMSDLAGVGFSFKVPKAWDCARANQAEGYVKYSCGASSGGAEAGGDLIVRACPYPCDGDRRVKMREQEEAWGLRWVRDGGFITWAETMQIDGAAKYGIIVVAYLRSSPEKAIDQQVVLRMTAPVEQADELRKVANSVRDAVR